MTPVTLARRLLPPGAAVAGGWIADLTDPPLPAEAAAVARAVPARQAEFAAGRTAARQAIAALGSRHGGVALPRRSDGPPAWPAGLTGSIAHGGGHVLAAVAHQPAVAALGLDLEPAGAVAPDLMDDILLPAERGAWANRLTAAFVAKEAAYKAQFMVTGRLLGFHDVRLAGDVAECMGLAVGLRLAEGGGFIVACAVIGG